MPNHPSWEVVAIGWQKYATEWSRKNATLRSDLAAERYRADVLERKVRR